MTATGEREQREGPRASEILRCAARVRLPAEQAHRLVSLAAEVRDWPALIQRARTQGVVPLLAWQLQSVAKQVIPPDVLAGLRTDLQDNAARNLLLTRELLELLHLFQQKGIPALAYKGPALAQFAYGNLALRSFGDLDILLHGSDIAKARELMCDRGYQAPEKWTPHHEALSLETLGQLPLQRGPTLRVELHTTLLPRAFTFRLEMRDLWPRRQTIDLLGRQVASLSPDDLLLLLCAHGTKHLWSKLMWVCDVAEFLRATGGLCGESIFQRSRQLHAERILLLGLTLAQRLFGADLPAGGSARGIAQPPVRGLADEVERRLGDGSEGPTGTLASCSFNLRVRERLRDGLRYCLSMAFTPTEADWLAGPRSQPRAWIYYLLRPIRLAGKYVRRWIVQLLP